jgi:hypothetical protein
MFRIKGMKKMKYTFYDKQTISVSLMCFEIIKQKDSECNKLHCCAMGNIRIWCIHSLRGSIN